LLREKEQGRHRHATVTAGILSRAALLCAPYTHHRPQQLLALIYNPRHMQHQHPHMLLLLAEKQTRGTACRYRIAAGYGYGHYCMCSRWLLLDACCVQGALKKKVTGPYVVGWFLGGQKSTRAGQIFFRDFFIVFLELPSPRNAQKRDKRKPRENRFGIFLSIFL
jgi:hypothetical protein